MGMKLKPSKCRSFSISAGQPKDIPFFIGENRVPSIKDEEQKFLGKLLFFSGKSEETFNLLKNTFKEGMDRIEKCFVRNEYKLWMYKEYFLPSKRFLLTVHTLTATHLKLLDTMTDQYVKKWAGLPKSATNAIIHLKEGMDLRSISDLYMEVHTASHTRTRLKGDMAINHVLDSTLRREGNLSRTSGRLHTTTVAEATFQKVLSVTVPGGALPSAAGEQDRQLEVQFSHNIQTQVTSAVRAQQQLELENHVKSLTLQGHVLALAAAEKQDIVWKSHMYNLKSGTLKFLLNAAIDTLPTAANLKRWKKSPSDLCKLCRGRQTTNHVLNCCSIALNTGRFTWRHDTLLSYIVASVDTSRFRVYSDLPGHQAAGGGSIPPEICITSQRPDVVVIDEAEKKIHLFELTMPSELNIDQRNHQKSQKYAHFLTDCTGYTSTLTCFEVSSKGYISPRNHQSLKSLHKFMKPQTKLPTFKQNLSALALYASYHIFLCRSDLAFTTPPFLSPPFADGGRSRAAGQ
jgi:hypothetical protein